MKDLTEQIYDELNAQVVRMLNHSLNQASRIVELETQLKDHSAQAFSIGETYANALSRIAELEAQIAKASTQVAERNPFAYGSSTKKNCILSKAQFDNCAPKNRTEYDLPLYTDPQVTSTDKAYEALLKLQFEDSDSDYKDGYNRGVRAAANFAVSMNISVPQSAAPASSEVL